MNLIDIVVGVTVVYGMIRGFQRGVIKEVLGLVGLIIAIWLGFRLAFIFANYYRNHFEMPENIVPFLAFLTAFALALVAVYLVGRFLTGAADAVQLTLVNKVAGAGFGGLKWAFLAGTLLTLVGTSEVLPPETQESSITYPHVKAYTETINQYTVALIPAARNVFQDMDQYFKGLDSTRTAQQAIKDKPPGIVKPNDSFPDDTGN